MICKEVLTKSMQGIQKEIDDRYTTISGIVCHPWRYIYKVKECLKIDREIKKLKIIKAELNLILELI